MCNGIEDLYDKVIINIIPSYMRKGLLLLALLLVQCTHNSRDAAMGSDCVNPHTQRTVMHVGLWSVRELTAKAQLISHSKHNEAGVTKVFTPNTSREITVSANVVHFFLHHEHFHDHVHLCRLLLLVTVQTASVPRKPPNRVAITVTLNMKSKYVGRDVRSILNVPRDAKL